MSKQTRITLRNLKVAKFASEETLCFEADVYFDGKLVGRARNDGHGGSTSIHALGPQSSDLYIAAEAWAKTLPDDVTDWDDPQELGKKFAIKMDLEHIVDQLSNDMLFRKDMLAAMKRDLKKKILFIKDGKLWGSAVKGVKALDAATAARLMQGVETKHPGCAILNRMPQEQALDAFIAANERPV